jgi:hypothetical protein
MLLYICPNYCHIKSSETKERCIHCGTWLISAGDDTPSNRERLQRDASQRQLAYKENFYNKKIV